MAGSGSFFEVRFPTTISWGSAGGPGFQTSMANMKAGGEQSNEDWEQQRCEFDVVHGLKSQADMDDLLAFWYAIAKGKANRFRYKDWMDYMAVDEPLGTGTGASQQLQLAKTYTAGGQTYIRNIYKPVWHTAVEADGTPEDDSVVIKFNGTPQTYGATWTMDPTTGLITCTAPLGQAVTWSGEFDVPVRFDIDKLKASLDAFDVYTWAQIPLVETLEYT